MENIKFYELEETYHVEKSSFEYPTVSYTKDSDTVWYMKKIQNIPYEVTEWFIDLGTEDNFDCGHEFDVKYSTLFDFVLSYYDENKVYYEDWDEYECSGSGFTFFGHPFNRINVDEDRTSIQLYMDGYGIRDIQLYRNRPNIAEVGCYEA
jgi:hypothetical protein